MLRFFILSLVLTHLIVSTANPSVNTLRPYEEIKLTYESQYNFFINYIKKHEGFRAKPYRCAGGYLTIGYGHQIQKGESLSYVSRKEAHAVLLKDFGKGIAVTEQDSLPLLIRIPVAHFVYCLGTGNYQRSRFRQHLLNKDYEAAGKELLKWCYINGEKSAYLLKMRKIEASFLNKC